MTDTPGGSTAEPQRARRDRPPRSAEDRRHDVRLILAGVAVVLLVWFAAANTQSVSIDFWVTTRSAPLIVVIVVSGLLGMVFAALLRRRRGHSRADQGRRR